MKTIPSEDWDRKRDLEKYNEVKAACTPGPCTAHPDGHAVGKNAVEEKGNG